MDIQKDIPESVTQKINEKFKDSLNEDELNTWKKVSRWYNNKILNIFIMWLNEKQHYWLTDWKICYKILETLKMEKNVTRFSDYYYKSIWKMFLKFVEFFNSKENKYELEDLLLDYFYFRKKNDFWDLWIITTWQEFMEKNESDDLDSYFYELKYLYRVLSENELKNIFNLFRKLSKELKEIREKWDKNWDPFEYIKNKLDSQLYSKYWLTDKSVRYINSLFWKYLNFLKMTKQIQNDFNKSKDQKNTIKQYDDYPEEEDEIIWTVENWLLTDAGDILPPDYWIFFDEKIDDDIDEDVNSEEKITPKKSKKSKKSKKKKQSNQMKIEF